MFGDLEPWLAAQLTKISGKSEMANAIRYAPTRLKTLRPHLDHGFLEIDNNAAERALKPAAPSRQICFENRLPGNDRTEKLSLHRLRRRQQIRRNRALCEKPESPNAA